MPKSKYYDHRKNRLIDLERDGCSLDKWAQRHAEVSFARHPKGFLVFLSPEKLLVSDEYSDSDPYAMIETLESGFQQRRIDATVALVREAVSQAGDALRILDLGCGQGHITGKIQEALPGAEICGLDYSISAVEYAHDHFAAIDFVVGDAYDSPYTVGYFDVIVCNNLWEHVLDPLFLLGKIKSLLKSSGYLVISTPSRYHLGNLKRVLLGKPVVFQSSHHVTEYSVGQVKEGLAYGGFRVRRVCSPPIPRDRLIARIARGVFSLWILLTGSHHQLEVTVFYLAQKFQ